MRVELKGPDSIVNELKDLFRKGGISVSRVAPHFVLNFVRHDEKNIEIDSIDSDLELEIFKILQQRCKRPIKLTGINSGDKKEMKISYHRELEAVLSGAICTAILKNGRRGLPLWKKLLPIFLLTASTAQGQILDKTCFWDSNVLKCVGAGDDSNRAIRVNCILGCGGGGSVDVTDRAGRLLGVVYGSQGQQLLQRATTFDLQVQLRTGGSEYDARQIRSLATGTDKIDARLRNAVDGAFIEPATDRTTAAGPFSVRLSTGAAFYNALQASDTLTAVTTLGSITNALPAGTNRIGSVRLVDSSDTDLTSAKGTQTSRFVGVQEMHDAGRTSISFYANAVASGTTGTETLITLTQSKGTAATTAAASYTITNGKTLRILQVVVGSRGHSTATIQITTFNLRMNTGGACVVGSTPILMGIATATPATSSAWDRADIDMGEGYDIVGNGTISICISANAVFVTNAPTWFVNIIGYEY